MGAFLEEARVAAARQYGARYWRWFAFAAVVRPLVPAVLTLVALGCMVAAGSWVAYRWDMVWSVLQVWVPAALWLLVAAAVLAGAVWVGSIVWRRNRWRWQAW